ncbi:MAG: DNA polymerase II small subunit [archaeon GW2011_AR10]|nr:MAG: DNA polymerase II small subunit [archaeon GW2011_AR10]
MKENLVLENSKEREIINYVSEKNALIDSKAVEQLAAEESFREIIDELLQENSFLITSEKVNTKLLKKDTKIGRVKEVIIKSTRFKAAAKEQEPNYKILHEYDVTDQSSCEGNVKDFMMLFRDKFEFLSEILKKRPQFSPKQISKLSRVSKNSDTEFVGMVYRKWQTKNDHLAIELEDNEASCIVLILKDDFKLNKLAEHLLLDDVIGVKARKIGDELFIAKEIFWPDLPQRPIKRAERNLSIVGISDLHVGSKLFLEKEFSNFIEWINGNTDSEKEKERIGRIKYLLICGDNVDGVGVYPDQFDELAIKDVFEQYDNLAELMKKIPEYIEVFIIPGQHDATRRADPQPAIPKEFRKNLAGYGNIHFLGSPTWVTIEGLKCMLYHGASLHDLYTSVNFLKASEPQKAMAELLKRRDIMITYGLRQPYVPEKKDYMLIREEPDFYFGGDMHHNGYDQYRGCSIINCGTWQERTEFQIQLGHIPTPGIAVEVDLNTREIREKQFYGGRNSK